MSSNLAFLGGGGAMIARQSGKLIARATFLAEVEALSQQLPDRPYVVNLCVDRYRFTVAWAAAMLRGQVSLLPTSRESSAVVALCQDYPTLYVLGDDDEASALPAPHFSYPKLFGANGGQVPAFPPDQVAAVLFTSGSTGRPVPSPRSWGRLVSSALAAGLALDVNRYAGAALVATVPHAHSYGLESAVMLPLQHGLLLTADRPFFPVDVAAALGAGSQPGILVTTPTHLRALVGDAPAPADSIGSVGATVHAGFVLSATAPLSPELAARGEATFHAPVFEIYGCSEAGQIATRRTTDGPVWRPLDGLRLRQDESGTWASGPHEGDVLLADEIELTGAGGFLLLGRTADMVNVAGKRSSLAYLTRQLTDIDGVEDGVFLMPQDNVASAPVRLTAIVVAPGLDAATILAALRGRIDPAFLPRPLHIVATLPRNALGKLPRAEMLQLMATPPPLPAPIGFHIPPEHPAGPGHFPGNPIVPGAVLLDQLVAAIFPNGWPSTIEVAKFHHPVRPGDDLLVTHREDGDSTRFECRLAASGQLVLSGALRLSFPPR